MYREYESALPGSAERILAMAEKEQNHRITWETTALNVSGQETKRGQWLGFAIVGKKIGTGNIVTTDAHDLECILCRSSALDMVLAEYGNSSNIDRFEQVTGKSVRAFLLERAMPFGRLRLAALQHPIIDLKQIRVPQFVDENTWSVRSEELIRRSTKSGLPEEIRELEYRIERLPKEDSWYIVRGHDLIEILRLCLRHALGDIGIGIEINEIARSLRLAMPLEDLRETNMWTDIRSWENSNPPYEALAD